MYDSHGLYNINWKPPLDTTVYSYPCFRVFSFYFIIICPLSSIHFGKVGSRVNVFKRFSRWCITQNYWVFGLFPLSIILEKMTFRKLQLLPSLGEGGGEKTPTYSWLRLALSKGPNWLWVGVFPASHEDGNRSRFRNVMFSRITDGVKSPKSHWFYELMFWLLSWRCPVWNLAETVIVLTFAIFLYPLRELPD
jgi:hypothetical protein